MENNSSQVVLVKDINPGSNNYGSYGSYPRYLTEFNDKLYFSAIDAENGEELWVSDGTTAGTQLVKDIYPGSNDYGSYGDSYPRNLVEFNNKLYFSANDNENGRELWVSDGTSEGTQLVKDINPDNSSFYGNNSSPYNLTEFNNKLYFSANDNENGRELWVSDGTTEGTQLVKDIYPGSDGSFPFDLTEFNDQLYFSAGNGENGNELWVSDGTTEGTQLVEDINPGSNNFGYAYGSSPSNLTEFNDQLYFSADDAENGRELWVSDGTTEGTQLVKDIYPGSGDSSPSNLTEFNNQLYFSADDAKNGEELWVSDGTSEGTQLVKDINPGNGNCFLSDLTEFNNKLYFTADDGENGDELWVSDGTSEGTQLVKDIYPGNNNDYGYANSSSPYNLTEFNNKLYFSARDGENGGELWVSDGTAAGTKLVEDINPGNSNSNPFDLTEFNDQLYFNANDGENGSELFKLIVDDSPTTNIITGTNGSDKLVGTDGADQIEGGNGKDKLVGNGGNDTLLGGNGNDKLVGGAGNDCLDGGNGKDILLGGSGNDIFILARDRGKDTIIDFDLKGDRLSLLGSLELDDLTFSGNTIQAGEEVLATLDGVNTEDLTPDNFL